LGATARFLGRLFLFAAAAVLFLERVEAARFGVGLGGVLDRASAQTRLLGGQRARPTAGSASARAVGSGAEPGPMTRFFLTSTVTVFERPWEKLWRTWPDDSGGRRNSSRPPVE